ncbi:MAG TPA: hypothetical protein VF911_03900 [Thermoanaerobaculia bacterium]
MLKPRAALNTPLAAAAIVAILYGVFIAALWNARGRDISRFVVAGEAGVDRDQIPEGLTVLPNSTGYDGLAFYRFALNPFTGQKVEFGISIDTPSYRHQRIGYPLLVWLITGGKPLLVPWALVLVNYAALIALGWAGAVLSQHSGRHALWAVLIPLYPGFVHSVSRDLSEPVACAFGLLALVSLAKRRYALAAAFLSYAVLTRETLLVLAIGIAVAWVWSRPQHLPRIVFVAPLAVYGLWQIVLTLHWGISPLQAGAQDLTLPFTGYARVLYESRSFRRLHRLHFSQALYLGIVAILTLLSWRKPRIAPLFGSRIAWLGYLALASTLPHAIWDEDVGYMRILGDLMVLSATFLLAASVRLRAVWLVCTGVVWYYLAAHLVEYS